MVCVFSRFRYLWDRLSEVEGLDLYGPPPNATGANRNPLVAFNSRDVHAHDLSFFIDQARGGVARGGGLRTLATIEEAYCLKKKTERRDSLSQNRRVCFHFCFGLPYVFVVYLGHGMKDVE